MKSTLQRISLNQAATIALILGGAALLPSALLSLTGCSSLGGGSASKPSDHLIVGPLLDRVVPSDFEGDGEFKETGQYLTLEVKAGGLRRKQNGAWTWKWLEYRRVVTIPIFTGLPYRQEGWIKLGTPTVTP